MIWVFQSKVYLTLLRSGFKPIGNSITIGDEKIDPFGQLIEPCNKITNVSQKRMDLPK